MKEALKLCIAELREARGEVEEVMLNCTAALAGTETGNRYVAQYRQQLARIDAAVVAAEAALARPGTEPVAWCVERVAPGMHDNGVRIGPWWRREDADAWAGDEYKVVALYASSAPAQSSELAAMTAERDQLRAEVERLRAQRVPLTPQQIDGLMPTRQEGRWSEFDLLWMARSVERAHGICD